MKRAVGGSMSATLTYFNGRGHGERIRYALAAAGIPFTEACLSQRGDMDAVRPRCLFGQVPLLDIDGVACVQSWATVRHIAAVSGMVPKEPALAWRADAVGEQVRDFFTVGNLVGFGWGERETDLAKAAAAAASHLPRFEALLLEGAPFVCGAEACWADYQLLYALNYCEDILPGTLTRFSRLATLRHTLNGLPHMASFLASMAKPLVDEQYKKEVKEAQLAAEL